LPTITFSMLSMSRLAIPPTGESARSRGAGIRGGELSAGGNSTSGTMLFERQFGQMTSLPGVVVAVMKGFPQ
jgi:hypothetical protein